jgi:hypothetical protein
MMVGMPLAALERELRDNSARAENLASRLPAAALARRPGPERWSPAECVEHLNLTTRAYLPLLDKGIADLSAKQHLSPGPYRMEWKARFFRWLLEPPARLKMPTLPPFQPVAIADPERVIPDFIGLQDQLLERLHRGDGLALDQYLIPSPFAKNVRYNLYAAFVVIAVHERRHLWQAERAAQFG